MSSMESLDKLQAELSGNVYGDAFHTLYKLSQDVSVEHAELMAEAMKWVRKEKVEPLEAENAKLRSLCAEVAGILFDLEVDRCGLCSRDSINHPCPAHTTKGGECIIKSELRKLGIEVNK